MPEMRPGPTDQGTSQVKNASPRREAPHPYRGPLQHLQLAKRKIDMHSLQSARQDTGPLSHNQIWYKMVNPSQTERTTRRPHRILAVDCPLLTFAYPGLDYGSTAARTGTPQPQFPDGCCPKRGPRLGFCSE